VHNYKFIIKVRFYLSVSYLLAIFVADLKLRRVKLNIMKKLTLIALVILLSFSAFAAEGGKKSDDTNKISSYVLRQFESEFYDAKEVTWTVNENYEKAEFVFNNVRMAAFYDVNGEYIGHTEVVSYNSLPSAARKQIARQYEGYHVKDLIRFEYAGASSSSLAHINAVSAYDNEVYFLSLNKAGKEATLQISPSSTVQLLGKN
jgi:hypothetical protein